MLLLAKNNRAAVMAVLSSGLHVSNDFQKFAIIGREIVQRMLVRGEISVWQMEGVCIFVTFAQSITFESIIL